MSKSKLVNTPFNPSKNHAPRITGLLFALLMSVIGFPVFAQTDSASSYEKALEQLVEIRDADIAKELALIEESYNRETRDLLRITMQIGNLETANKVKRMLENPDKKAAQYGETTNSTQEKAVVRLMEQREKQIAQATAPTVPIQKWFKESSERLVRKAVQAGDLAVANKLKAMIDQAGGAAGGNKVSGDKNIVVKAVQPSDLAAANKVKAMIDPASGAAGGNKVSVDKNMVLVEGGTVTPFSIGRYETTWGEYRKVVNWAVQNGYEFRFPREFATSDSNHGEVFTGSTYPAYVWTWNDAAKWCNAKSQMEGFQPAYTVNGTVFKTGQQVPEWNANATGYRLPTEAEWEWAARGGALSKGYTYAGSNNIEEVAWYWNNSPNIMKPVGGKLPNELGIYDMSGNQWEWCWDAVTGGRARRGGAGTPDHCTVFFRNGINVDFPSMGIRPVRNAIGDMVTVQGGTLPASSSLGNQTVATFQVGRTEVTWGEWQKVRDWAVANGYDLKDVGQGLSEKHPVNHVTWYDVVKWCNAKSEKEGKTPVYQVSGTTYKTGVTEPTVSESANGYRLPSEKEWEWAARGGKNSKGYTYAGSNDLNAVGWFNGNSEERTHEAGTKLANELGIYDMSGNVWEWCFDLVGTSARRIRGGSSFYPDGYAAVSYLANYSVCNPGNFYGSVGFRLARSSGN